MSRWLAIAALVWVGCTKGEADCPTVENQCEEQLGRPVQPDDACVELAYNGEDEDCANGDWVDIDGDGVPSMTISEYEDQNPGKDWPSEVTGVREPLLVDCNDFAFNIHPGADETLDDGVDSNCDKEDDLDVDGDGYEPGIVEVDEGCEATSIPPCGDCDDADPEVHPGASPDIWYDGIDTNCDGANDFDQDGDNYNPDHAEVDIDDDGVPDLIDVMPAYNAYKVKYGYNYLGVGTGDCVDFTPDRTDLPAGFDPALIYPFAPEIPYNSIDEDCQQDDDFDGDRDGYQPDGYISDSAEYFTWWGYELPASFLTGDCLDTDAAVHPDALEILGDGADYDCDGQNDGAVFDTRSYGWDDPHDIYIGKTVSRYSINTTSEYSDLGGSRQTTRSGVAFYFDIADILAEEDPHPTPDVPTPWWPAGRTGSTSHVIGPSYASTWDDDSVYMALSLTVAQDASTDVGYIVVRRAYDDTSTRELLLQSAESSGSLEAVDTFADMDVEVDDDGWIWAWGCGDNTAGLLVSEISRDALTARGDDAVSGTGRDADTAVLVPTGPDEATGYCCASGVCDEYALSHDTDSATIGARATSIAKYRAGHGGPDWRAYAQGTGKGAMIEDRSGDSWTALSGKTLTDVAVATSGSKFVVFGATDTDLVLGYGNRGSLIESTFSFSDGDSVWAANRVGVYADNDRVILAASRSDGVSAGVGTPDTDDHVGWVFLGRAF